MFEAVWTLLAEIPGKFKIQPHKGYAMYAPQVRDISDSADLAISGQRGHGP